MRLQTALFLVLIAAAGCKKPPAAPAVPQAPVKLPDGLTYQVLAPGSGDEVKAKDKITVHYVGTLQDGTKFDSSRDRDRPFAFWIGEGQVIKGWDEGLLGMREGELRKLVVPPALGYGSTPKPKIPANSTLVFEVELIDIR